jgi:hypothetical protein
MARELLTHHRERARVSWRTRILLAAVVVTALCLSSTGPAAASTGIQPPSEAGLNSLGVCTLSGTVTFNPSLHAVPATGSVNIGVGGNCLGLNTSPTVNAGYGASFVTLSCEAGVGTVTASEMFSTGAPPAPGGSGFLVAGPGTIEITVSANLFTAVLVLAWTNPVATATCPVSGSGTNPIPVTGTMVFEYGL